MFTALQARALTKLHTNSVQSEIGRIDACIKEACARGDHSCCILTKIPHAITDCYSQHGYMVVDGPWKTSNGGSLLILSWKDAKLESEECIDEV